MHSDAAIFFCSHKPDGKGLNDWNQGHVGIGSHRDRTNVRRMEHLGTRMDVGPSAAPMIPMDAASFRSNPRSTARLMAAKIPNWAPGSEKEHFGIGEKRAEVDHGADTDKKKDGQSLRGVDAHLKEPFDDALGLNAALQGLIQYP